jgi:aspartate-semialdehyde dehydrogenase
MKNKILAVVGATGRVGREMLSILRDEGVSAQNISAIASSRSAGGFINYDDSKLCVTDLEKMDFSGIDIALFSAGGDVSRVYAPIAAAAGCTVIDNTSCFRMDPNVPLIVPEINFADIRKYENKSIISNPNCSTIQMVMVLKPLHDIFQLEEVVISTYQATSGAGQKGVDELMEQTRACISGTEIKPHHFKRQIAFNLIPQIDVFTDSLYTKEELKMMNETKKILSIDDIDITATCVRVPVIVGHAVSVFAKFHEKTDLEVARQAVGRFSGLALMDEPEEYVYSTPIDAASKDAVFVSRMRKHPTIEEALSFWCVSDNVRKGAALNAVQIAKML